MIGAALEALFHYVRAELLDGQQSDLPDNALAYCMYIFIRAHIKDVLNDVVSVSILHELQRLSDDAKDQMRPCRARRRIEATLNDAATVAMACDITNALGNSIKHKLGMFVTELQ